MVTFCAPRREPSAKSASISKPPANCQKVDQSNAGLTHSTPISSWLESTWIKRATGVTGVNGPPKRTPLPNGTNTEEEDDESNALWVRSCQESK
ncbi:hypothetical protein ANCDUO_15996 [Ancylostoma duodenale]|uniref:Uncharacterized protein n=1 Tax=Ancylostoma duodenale TaxID=51022 RepID=A0A0C2G4L5_9BILA|nr:hypothetical protein ANCDUO_15996 [Ancylostoma duodenale]